MSLRNRLFRHRRLLAVLLLAGLGAGIWWWHGRSESAQDSATTLVRATTGDIEETVTAQGTLEPKEFVNVGAQVSGQLLKLHVQVGQDVSVSQLVAEIDPRVYESRLDEAQAQIKSLKAQLELAQQQHARNTQLVEAQAVSRDAYDTSAAQVKSLKAQIEQANSTLNEARTNLSYTRIFAPMAGTVISQTAREGQTLNANQTAPAVVEVANLDVMTVRAQVAEADIAKIKAGMEVYFTTLGGDRTWRTTVAQVLPAPQIVNDVVLYNVLADVDNTDRSLMSGMSTQMNFVVGQAKDAVLVPANALGKKLGAGVADKGVPYQIFVPQGKDAMVSKTVRIGLMNRSMAQVLEGLKAGDTVAVPTATMEANGSGRSGGRRMMGPRL